MNIIRNGGFDMSSMQIDIDCENVVDIERYAQIAYKNIEQVDSLDFILLK